MLFDSFEAYDVQEIRRIRNTEDKQRRRIHAAVNHSGL